MNVAGSSKTRFEPSEFVRSSHANHARSTLAIPKSQYRFTALSRPLWSLENRLDPQCLHVRLAFHSVFAICGWTVEHWLHRWCSYSSGGLYSTTLFIRWCDVGKLFPSRKFIKKWHDGVSRTLHHGCSSCPSCRKTRKHFKKKKKHLGNEIKSFVNVILRSFSSGYIFTPALALCLLIRASLPRITESWEIKV